MNTEIPKNKTTEELSVQPELVISVIEQGASRDHLLLEEFSELDTIYRYMVSILVLQLTEIFLSISLVRESSPFYFQLKLIINAGLVVTIVSYLIFMYVERVTKSKKELITYRMNVDNEEFFRSIENEVLSSIKVTK